MHVKEYRWKLKCMWRNVDENWNLCEFYNENENWNIVELMQMKFIGI